MSRIKLGNIKVDIREVVDAEVSEFGIVSFEEDVSMGSKDNLATILTFHSDKPTKAHGVKYRVAYVTNKGKVIG